MNKLDLLTEIEYEVSIKNYDRSIHELARSVQEKYNNITDESRTICVCEEDPFKFRVTIHTYNLLNLEHALCMCLHDCGEATFNLREVY